MTEWRVTTSEGELKLTPMQVVQLLAEKVAKNHKPDVDALVGVAGKYLETNGAVLGMKVEDLIHFGWMMGYYYNVFLSNNKVDVRSPSESDSSIDRRSTTAPDGESRGSEGS